MSPLDHLKTHWQQSNPAASSEQAALDEASLRKMIKSSVSKHTKASLQYFWASLSLQILVYALFTHLVIQHWHQRQVLLLSLLGVLLYLPFTVMLMKRFKRLAAGPLPGNENLTIRDYIWHQQHLLASFFTFKKRYELVLIPLSTAIGVILVFTLYVPGGVGAFPVGALITYGLALLACYVAIRAENKNSFTRPLQQLQAILQEYQE